VIGRAGAQRALVVDDIADVRALISRALASGGYEVDVACTLDEARALDPASYDAVLVDANLGTERGIDLVEALRSADPGAVGRCLVLSGGMLDTLPPDVARLAKPFRIDELLGAVQALGAPQPAGRPPTPAHTAPDNDPQLPLPRAPVNQRPPGCGPSAWQLLHLARRLREQERRDLADYLHEGPVQELTAVTLELEMMRRSIPPELGGMADAAQRRLTAAIGSLRGLLDPHRQVPAYGISLAAAIEQGTAWLPGVALSVAATAATGATGLDPQEIPVVADVVELMLLGIVPADPPLRTRVAVQVSEHRIEVSVALELAQDAESEGGDVVGRSAAREWADRLAAALGTSAQTELRDKDWLVRIALERQPALAPGAA